MAIRFDCPACGKRTQAPEELAGKRARCPLCQKIITVPEPGEVEEAPLAEAAPPRSSARRSTEGDGDERRRPCPMCGELIREEAVRCRYCGEELDESGPRPRRRRRSRSDADSDLSAGDWLIAILCSGIGCIIGIIWMIQGKPKGTKMFAVSVGVAVVGTIIRFALAAALHVRP